MRRWAIAALLCSLLGLPSAAGAQDLLGASSGNGISSVELKANLQGEVSVAFHGDPASGCAALAGCGYRGVITWTPNGGGAVELDRYEQGGRVHLDASILLGLNAAGTGSLTASDVQRLAGGQPVGLCGDEQNAPTFIDGTANGGAIRFTLDDELSPTRCAGPLPSDLTGAAPSVTISTHALERGHVRLDFRSERSFAGHGFAGTLTSTVVVTVGAGERQAPPPASALSLPGGTKPMRVVTERVSISRLSGSLSATVTGTSDTDVCVLLDSCGLAGTLTIAPKPSAPLGELVATGPASRPERDFLTALGLSSAGRSAGIGVTGEVLWSDAGTVAAALAQPSGTCSDRAPIGLGAATFEFTRRSVKIGYLAGGPETPVGQSALRTRCPGPIYPETGSLAYASVPRSRLAKRTFTVRLRGTWAFEDQGYDASLHGVLTFRFRRGQISQQIENVPSF